MQNGQKNGFKLRTLCSIQPFEVIAGWWCSEAAPCAQCVASWTSPAIRASFFGKMMVAPQLQPMEFIQKASLGNIAPISVVCEIWKICAPLRALKREVMETKVLCGKMELNNSCDWMKNTLMVASSRQTGRYVKDRTSQWQVSGRGGPNTFEQQYSDWLYCFLTWGQ